VRAPAPAYAPNDGVIEAATVAIGATLLEAQDLVGEVTLLVERNALVPAMIALRDTPGLEYQQLMEIAGVDYPSRPERFDVCYHLLSVTRNHRIRVRVRTDEVQPVPSVTGIWPVAGWLEREVFDMYGVIFEGNLDLRRILTDYGFRGHPQRKDFPLSGFTEVRYSETSKRVVYEPITLPQEFRSFDFMSPWEGAEYVLPGDEKAAPAGEHKAALPQAKGAPSPVTAEQVRRADEPKKDSPPQATTSHTVETRAETGVGNPDAGNKPEEKPVDPAVIPTKGKGQNQ
jgi:NADH-quinone oxidoreductase subunit C